MPAIFTSISAEIERKDPGIGGKPPVTRRPTGGGGGGGDDEWKKESRGPRELLRRVRLVVFSILGLDVLFFAGMVLIFFARQSGLRMDPHTHFLASDWRPILLPPILYLNTALLALSCLSMERARKNIFREIDVLEEWLGLGKPALRSALPWMGATFLLGMLFLIGQVVAWKQLAAVGFTFGPASTPASNFFYILTGAHAAHLVVGALALALCLTALGLFKRVEHRQVAVDSTAWLWHTMGGVWLALLAVLALGQ
jgi:cytochrome c oxidase subunit 3